MKRIFKNSLCFVIALLAPLFFIGCTSNAQGNPINPTPNPNPLPTPQPQIDYPGIQNQIMAQHIRACVTIEVEFYNTFLGIKTEWMTQTGSGVIFDEGKYNNSNDRYYYVITNNHVTSNGSDKNYSERTVKVIDYLGNTYTAQKTITSSSAYDLSALYFTKKIDLYVLTRAATNPTIAQDIIAVGQPGGQTNTVTWGKVQYYGKVTTDDKTSNVQFNVLIHTAPIASGSSGGPLLNTNLRIVAINFAGTTSGYGAAIPIEKVNEFLRTI